MFLIQAIGTSLAVNRKLQRKAHIWSETRGRRLGQIPSHSPWLFGTIGHLADNLGIPFDTGEPRGTSWDTVGTCGTTWEAHGTTWEYLGKSTTPGNSGTMLGPMPGTSTLTWDLLGRPVTT